MLDKYRERRQFLLDAVVLNYTQNVSDWTNMDTYTCGKFSITYWRLCSRTFDENRPRPKRSFKVIDHCNRPECPAPDKGVGRYHHLLSRRCPSAANLLPALLTAPPALPAGASVRPTKPQPAHLSELSHEPRLSPQSAGRLGRDGRWSHDDGGAPMRPKRDSGMRRVKGLAKGRVRPISRQQPVNVAEGRRAGPGERAL